MKHGIDSKKIIRKLARESLDNKWYDIDPTNRDHMISDCAFCSFVGECGCRICPIQYLPICDSIRMAINLGDKDLIVEALEQLADTGELTEEMIIDLNDFKREEEE